MFGPSVTFQRSNDEVLVSHPWLRRAHDHTVVAITYQQLQLEVVQCVCCGEECVRLVIIL
jgi:hypothetical protein